MSDAKSSSELASRGTGEGRTETVVDEDDQMSVVGVPMPEEAQIQRETRIALTEAASTLTREAEYVLKVLYPHSSICEALVFARKRTPASLTVRCGDDEVLACLGLSPLGCLDDWHFQELITQLDRLQIYPLIDFTRKNEVTIYFQ